MALSDLGGAASGARISADEVVIDAANFRVNSDGELEVHSITADNITAGSITANEISNSTGILRNVVVLPDDVTGNGDLSFFSNLSISTTLTTVTFQRHFYLESSGGM